MPKKPVPSNTYPSGEKKPVWAEGVGQKAEPTMKEGEGQNAEPKLGPKQ